MVWAYCWAVVLIRLRVSACRTHRRHFLNSRDLRSPSIALIGVRVEIDICYTIRLRSLVFQCLFGTSVACNPFWPGHFMLLRISTSFSRSYNSHNICGFYFGQSIVSSNKHSLHVYSLDFASGYNNHFAVNVMNVYMDWISLQWKRSQYKTEQWKRVEVLMAAKFSMFVVLVVCFDTNISEKHTVSILIYSELTQEIMLC